MVESLGSVFRSKIVIAKSILLWPLTSTIPAMTSQRLLAILLLTCSTHSFNLLSPYVSKRSVNNRTPRSSTDVGSFLNSINSEPGTVNTNSFEQMRNNIIFDGPESQTVERDACGVGFIVNTKVG